MTGPPGPDDRARSVYLGPWRIDVVVRSGVRSPLAVAAIVRSIAGALDAGGAPAPASLGLILAADAELAGLNEAHLGQAGPTDVLSFPLLPPDAYPPHERGTGPAVPANHVAFDLPPGRRPHLGDVVISIERAEAQVAAGRGGQTGDVRWSAADEVRLLAVHGTLHVCGWDHAEPVEEAAMRALERRLLAG